MTTKTSAARSARFQTKIEVQLQCNSFKTCQVCRNLPQVTPFYILDFTPTKWIWSCGNEPGDWYTHDGRKQVVGRCCCPILIQRVDAIEWSVSAAWADLRWDPRITRNKCSRLRDGPSPGLYKIPYTLAADTSTMRLGGRALVLIGNVPVGIPRPRLKNDS